MGKEEVEERIKKAHNFSELYSTIRQAGEVKGTQKSYSPNEMIKIIESVRHGEELNYITRAHGLREKVKELRGEEEIGAAKSFEELYRAVERTGDIKGTVATYSPGDIRSLVEAARHGENINYITRTFGLRHKVKELIEKSREDEREIPGARSFRAGLESAGYRKHNVFMESPGEVKRDEGFKIHVSADAKYAKNVLDMVLPVLKKENVVHKVVESPWALEKIMTGTQTGKFITVYPESNEEAKRIAKEIDNTLAGKKLHGPKIPNDNALPRSKSGLVYYRYGGFTKGTITGPHGEQVPDRRDGPAVPKWMKDIFKE